MTLRAALGLAAALLALPSGAETACAPDRVDLRGEGLRESFAVDVADEPAERSLGLMNRPSMPADRGMLFVYPEPRTATFWMKDTLIPLDILFADQAGVVRHIHPMAVPLDTTPIPGGSGVKFVLEINGGLAERLGIAPGAELRHPAVGSGAAWPCG
jgi:uncharacterized protein